MRECFDKAVQWLRNSDIRNDNGGYKSVYNPATGEYHNWGGGRSCLLNTAGSVLAFLELDDLDRAVTSAEHILDLSIREKGPFIGAILAGENSKYIYAYYIAFAIRALVALYRRTQLGKYLDAAVRAARWVARHMMNGDGSISEVNVFKNRNLRDIFSNQFLTWQAVFVDAFISLEALTEDEIFKAAKTKLLGWLKRIQREDGSYYVYSRPLINRLARSVYTLDFSNLKNDFGLRHATSNSTALEAFVLSSNLQNAEKVYSWMVRKLDNNGLFYQYYFDRGGHSVEEDVMPTAHFGVTMLKHQENRLFINCEEICRRIANGIGYAQVSSTDLNSDGGIKGLPLHETKGQNIYCWDTQYSILFLNEMLVE